MSIIIDVNRCYYKYLINGAEVFDCFTEEEQETIMHALGFIIEEDAVNKEKYLVDTYRKEYRSKCDEAWGCDIEDAVVYESIDHAFGDICEPYVVDYFDGILAKDLGTDIPEGVFEEYDYLRKIIKLIDDEKKIDTDGEKIPNMYIRVYQELFNVVCLFDKDGKKLYERYLKEIAEKISAIQSVITIDTVINTMYELGFKLCQKDKSILSKMIEREMMLFHHGIPKGKLNMIASYAGAGKTRHPSFVHIDEEFTPVKNIVKPAFPLEISKKFFNKQVSEEITKRGKSLLDTNERLLEDIQKLDLRIIPRQVLKQMEHTYYGISGDRRSHKEKVEESNKHFKDLANRKIRK